MSNDKNVGLDGNFHTDWTKLPPADPIADLRGIRRGGVQIVTNKADKPIDVDKLIEHLGGGHESHPPDSTIDSTTRSEPGGDHA